MAINTGDTAITGLYNGNTAIDKVYKNDELIWPVDNKYRANISVSNLSLASTTDYSYASMPANLQTDKYWIAKNSANQSMVGSDYFCILIRDTDLQATDKTNWIQCNFSIEILCSLPVAYPVKLSTTYRYDTTAYSIRGGEIVNLTEKVTLSDGTGREAMRYYKEGTKWVANNEANGYVLCYSANNGKTGQGYLNTYNNTCKPNSTSSTTHAPIIYSIKYKVEEI